MILDGQQKYLVSSFGWVEKGGFVRRDIRSGEVIRVPVADADWLRLYRVDDERFLVAGHSRTRSIFTLSVHRFESPANPVWSLIVTPTHHEMRGNPSDAANMPRFHLVTFKVQGSWENYLLTVSADGTSAKFGQVPWFNSGAYDLGYQGLVDAVALPNSGLVLISVQRSSTVIVHDPMNGKDIGRIELAGRVGNPMLSIVGNELWTIDYDTFLRIDLATRKPIMTLLVQSPTPSTHPGFKGMMNQFAGELFIWRTYKKMIIPRPFSGDIAIVDPFAGKIESAIVTGSQPISCVVTDAGRLIARDWKSGRWITADIKHH